MSRYTEESRCMKFWVWQCNTMNELSKQIQYRSCSERQATARPFEQRKATAGQGCLQQPNFKVQKACCPSAAYAPAHAHVCFLAQGLRLEHILRILSHCLIRIVTSFSEYFYRFSRVIHDLVTSRQARYVLVMIW